jgi:GGDEF domain-containing protein
MPKSKTIAKLIKPWQLPQETNPLAQTLAANTEKLKQYQSQQQVYFRLIMLLIIIAFTLFLLVMRFYYRLRHHQAHHSHYVYHDENALLANFDYTKKIYQRMFKQARQYQYPFSVALIKIKDWENLSSKLEGKVLAQIDSEIAKIIVRSINETDSAGHLSSGEYLVLFEHQDQQVIEGKIDKIHAGIAAMHFAQLPKLNLSLNITFASPTIQDIDPYQFLAQLTLTTQNKEAQ